MNAAVAEYFGDFDFPPPVSRLWDRHDFVVDTCTRIANRGASLDAGGERRQKQ